MLALVDCDIFCYEFGSAKAEDGNPLEWNFVTDRIDRRIQTILEDTGASGWDGFLTGKNNFREKIATILPYKGNRDRGERPFWYQGIYNYLRDHYPVTVVDGKEADDEIADRHSVKSTIVCSLDKDFKQLEGWHYEWPTYRSQSGRLHYIDGVRARRNLYCQVLIGDGTDNILGIFGVGEKSAAVKRLEDLHDEEEMRQYVLAEYGRRFGTYGLQFFTETYRLVKLGDVDNVLS